VNVTLSKRMTVSLALQVAFVIAGCAYAQYSKVLKQCLGMSSVSTQVFIDTIKLLQEVMLCDKAKNEMKSVPHKAESFMSIPFISI